jgi:glycerol-3-phosphate cytidylyltransferase-like family protein
MATGYFVGIFEVLEVSTIDVLTQARSLCDRLMVAILDDEEAQALREPDTVPSLDDRAAVIEQVRGVDGVVVHDRLPADAPIYYFEAACASIVGDRGQLLRPSTYSQSPYSPYRPQE